MPKQRRPKVEGIQLVLAIDDVRLLEEALHTYRREIEEDLGKPAGASYTAQQRWAYDRAEHLRRQMEAAVNGYSYKPPPPQPEPGGLATQRIQRALAR